jgi:transcriptional accessory protein Tex/SPT6
LRIKNGKEPLDMTGIHPEIHKQVYAFLEGELGIKKKDLKLPLENVSRPSEATVRERAEKYDI